MHASMPANLICGLVKARVRLGYDFARARDFQWLFTNHRLGATGKQHVQDAMLQFARSLGVPRRQLRWDIPLSPAHREFAAQYQSDGRPILVISPCSRERHRNWSAENYAAAANYARKKFNCRIILTGGKSETELHYGKVIQRLTDPSLVNLIGKTSLKQLLAILDRADALLCPDSGPAHLATTVHTPVIGLYASTNAERTGPYFSRDLCVDSYAEALRSYLGKAPAEVPWGLAVFEPHAMGLIRLARVKQQLDRVLAVRASARSRVASV
jgi:heptosyltransferase I